MKLKKFLKKNIYYAGTFFTKKKKEVTYAGTVITGIEGDTSSQKEIQKKDS